MMITTKEIMVSVMTMMIMMVMMIVVLGHGVERVYESIGTQNIADQQIARTIWLMVRLVVMMMVMMEIISTK